jgi:zinc transporter ZupT
VAPTCSAAQRHGLTRVADLFSIDQIAAPGAHASSSPHSQSSEGDTQRNRTYLPSHRPEALRLTRASSLMIAKTSPGISAAEQAKQQASTVESSPEQMPADHDQVSDLQSPLLGNGVRPSPRHPSSVRRLSESGDRDGEAVGQSRGLRGAFASIAGLVIHAAADGIAMGASAGSGDDSLKLIVLFAIMIHKAVSA